VSKCTAQWGNLSDSDDETHYAYVVKDLDEPTVIAKFLQSQMQGGDPWAHMRESTVNASDEVHLELMTEPWVLEPLNVANAFIQVGIQHNLYLDDAVFGNLPEDADMPALIYPDDDMPPLVPDEFHDPVPAPQD